MASTQKSKENLAILYVLYVWFFKRIKRIKFGGYIMKIKLFYQKYNESLDDFEYRVNQFTLSVSVIDIKFSEATYGNYEDMSTITGLLVLYR